VKKTVLDADIIVSLLKLVPHPEGGVFRETYRAASAITGTNGRSVCTAIYYMLREGEQSEWHRVAQDEIYHFYAGHALELLLISPEGEFKRRVLGSNLQAGEEPQIVIPAYYWQCSRSTGAFTLMGCTVAPGFLYEDFELSSSEAIKRRYPHLSHLF